MGFHSQKNIIIGIDNDGGSNDANVIMFGSLENFNACAPIVANNGSSPSHSRPWKKLHQTKRSLLLKELPSVQRAPGCSGVFPSVALVQHMEESPFLEMEVEAVKREKGWRREEEGMGHRPIRKSQLKALTSECDQSPVTAFSLTLSFFLCIRHPQPFILSSTNPKP
ncbi:hypothetical protein RIF29_11602 [Crotalaria pallida]|uniref:Uncharacterized protein n=1 Tax=Crotalaria pallida TaxID=3830 RepID=A0AAN9IMB4_CROPI